MISGKIYRYGKPKIQSFWHYACFNFLYPQGNFSIMTLHGQSISSVICKLCMYVHIRSKPIENRTTKHMQCTAQWKIRLQKTLSKFMKEKKQQKKTCNEALEFHELPTKHIFQKSLQVVIMTVQDVGGASTECHSYLTIGLCLQRQRITPPQKKHY